VLLFQFALEPLLALFDSKNMTSAAERLGSSSFGQSGRHYEWLKAWKSFQAAPWFGHGWGSYSLQGFLINDVYPDGYRPYENGVLFTHSHNSLLNLLAEMGIAGTALVLGGLLWVLHGSLKRTHAAQGVFVLGAISVSLVHSLLEYPLWYIYFLSAFSLFVGFAPAARESQPAGSLKTDDATRSGLIYSGMAALLALALCGGIMRLAAAYQELRAVAGNIPADLRERSRNTMSLLQIAKTEPMLKYYAQYHLMNYIDPRDGRFPDWAYQAGRDALRYRPFANSYKWALLAYRNGDKAEAERCAPLTTPLRGVNNRNLRTFEVDLQQTIRLLPYLSDNALVITESGITGKDDIRFMQQHGVNSFLIGETFMRAPDIEAAVRQLF